MMKFSLPRVASCAAAALLFSAAGNAQQFNFGTRGQFTTPGVPSCTTAAVFSVTCTSSGFSLNFTGVAPIAGNYLNNSTVSLGTLTLSGAGSVVVPPSIVNFTLFVDNTFPTAGTGTFSGFIAGQVTVGPGVPQFSSLVWSPNTTTTADGVTYSLIVDAITGGVNIPANGNVDIRARAVVTTVPEPASVVLLAGGMLALLAVAKRKSRFV